RFAGTPEMLVAYFQLLADEVRALLASLGMRSISELLGRTDVLTPRADVTRGLDVEALLRPVPAGPTPADTSAAKPNLRAATDTRGLVPEVGRTRVTIAGTVSNVDRAVGARLAAALAARGDARPSDAVRMRLRGSAGQSFGAFCVAGMSLHLTGEA